MKWRKDEWGVMKDEGWWFQAVEGFWLMTDGQTDRQTDGQTNICDYRVAFATEKYVKLTEI